MVNWNDPDLEAKLGILLVQLLYAILGLYGGGCLLLTHAQLTYITARFSFLIAIILHATQSSPFYTSVNCQSECFFWTNVAIGCSTTNLMIRTWLIWKTSYLLRLLLVLLSLGHWTLLTLFLATARASIINGVCVINFVDPVYTSAVIIYAMLYDLALLVFTVVGLLRMPSSSTLWKTLVKQGVIYFIFNFLANLIFLVLNRLNLNSIMNAIFGMPGMCPCTIASNQVVLSLLRPSSNYESDSPSSGKVHPLTSNLTVRVPW
ncbi:hypothetical protein F4604DRAFT_1759495 [Suillus subluteus]|nr:hypothetical protein F4604DRAFT_1759495 [Suillus subluteus]